VLEYPKSAAFAQKDIDDGHVAAVGPPVHPGAGVCLGGGRGDDVSIDQFLERGPELFGEVWVVLDQQDAKHGPSVVVDASWGGRRHPLAGYVG